MGRWKGAGGTPRLDMACAPAARSEELAKSDLHEDLLVDVVLEAAGHDSNCAVEDSLLVQEVGYPGPIPRDIDGGARGIRVIRPRVVGEHNGLTDPGRSANVVGLQIRHGARQEGQRPSTHLCSGSGGQVAVPLIASENLRHTEVIVSPKLEDLVDSILAVDRHARLALLIDRLNSEG